jgi:hypothetical protein
MQAQDATQVQLTMYSASFPGQPVFAVMVEADLARQFAQGQIPLDDFMSGWQIEDLRSTELSMTQELENLGYKEVTVSLAGPKLQVCLEHPPVSTAQSLLESLLPVFDLAARQFPEIEQVQLTLSGPGAFRISLPLEAITAYRTGQLDAAMFLLQMELEEVQ